MLNPDSTQVIRQMVRDLARQANEKHFHDRIQDLEREIAYLQALAKSSPTEDR